MMDVCQVLVQTGVPNRRWMRIIHENDKTSLVQEERSDFSEPLDRLMRGLLEKPPESLKQVIGTINKTPTLASIFVGGGGDSSRDQASIVWWATNILGGQFIQAYFAQAPSTIFSEPVFELVFQRLIRDIESSTRTVHNLNPLINTRLINSERIDVAPGLVIRRLTDDELEEWLNDYLNEPVFSDISGMRVFDICQMNCAIDVTYDLRKHENWESPKDLLSSVTDILTTLRILTDQNVHIAFTKQISDSFFHSSAGRSPSIPHRPIGAVANIEASINQSVIDLWNRIHSLPNGSPMKLALKRWDMVSERFDEYDKLIDYWIAFESLFASDSSQEVTYRASLRIAALIGNTSEEKVQLYKDLRESYKLRSEVVHGSVPKNKKNAYLLVDKTRSYLRRALLKLLSSGQAFDPAAMEIELLSQYKG